MTDHIAAAAKILSANIVHDSDVRRAGALAQLAAATELRLLRQQAGCRAVPMGSPDGANAALARELSQHRQALLLAEDALSKLDGHDHATVNRRLSALLLVRQVLGIDQDGQMTPPEAAHAAADVDEGEGER